MRAQRLSCALASCSHRRATSWTFTQTRRNQEVRLVGRWRSSHRESVGAKQVAATNPRNNAVRADIDDFLSRKRLIEREQSNECDDRERGDADSAVDHRRGHADGADAVIAREIPNADGLEAQPARSERAEEVGHERNVPDVAERQANAFSLQDDPPLERHHRARNDEEQRCRKQPPRVARKQLVHEFVHRHFRQQPDSRESRPIRRTIRSTSTQISEVWACATAVSSRISWSSCVNRLRSESAFKRVSS